MDTLIGGLIALASGLLVHIFDERRARRQEKARFHDVRMSTYADFLDVATLLYANPTVIDEATGRALRKLNQTYSLIQLIATEAVAEAASDIYGAAGSPRVEKKAVSEDDRRKFTVDYNMFKFQARRELGIGRFASTHESRRLQWRRRLRKWLPWKKEATPER